MNRRIGILVDFLEEQYQTGIIASCIEVIKNAKDRCFIFSGGQVNNQGSPDQNYLYDLAQEGLDGLLVLAGSLLSAWSMNQIEDYLDSKFSCPKVLISARSDRFASVTVDNYQGMYDVVDHLAKVHGCRHIAFFRKTPGHSEGDERYKAWCDAMRDNGLDYGEAYVVPGTLYLNPETAVQYLFEKLKLLPGKNLDALVTTDTWQLNNLSPFLEERGYKIPDSLKAASFDFFMDHSMNFEPTCAHQPYDLLGAKAYELLRELMDGRPVEMNVKIPAQLILGNSCTCIDSIYRMQDPVFIDKSARTAVFPEDFDRMLDEIADLPEKDFVKPKDLVEAFRKECAKSKGAYAFENLQIEVQSYTNIVRLLSYLKTQNTAVYSDYIQQLNAVLWGIWQKVMLLQSKAAQTHRMRSRKVREILNSIYAGSTLKDVYYQFFYQVKLIGVRYGYIVLGGNKYQKDSLVAWLDVHQDPVCREPGDLELSGTFLDLQEILNSRFTLFSQECRLPEAVLFLPLKYNAVDLGYFCLEIPPEYWDDYFLFETFRLVLSSSLYSAMALAETKTALSKLTLAHEQLMRSETLASLGSLVAGIAHEVNTPLGVALTAGTFMIEQIQSIKKSSDSGVLTRSEFTSFLDKSLEASHIVVNNCGRAADLMQSFKQVSVDKTSDQKRTIRLAEYLQEVVTSLHPRFRKTKHQIHIDCPQDLKIETFPGALAQILTNALMNSLIHGFAGIEAGIISIQASWDPQDQNLILEYKDNGLGLDEDSLDKIFVPFKTSKADQGGSGLGTSIIHTLVTEKFGGDIVAKSEPGKGLSYTMHLPAKLV